MFKVLLAIATLLLVSGCSMMGYRVHGSGNVVTRKMELADFTRVDAGSAFQVEITRADSFSVSITADDNLFDYIRAAKENSTLALGLEPAFRYSFRPTKLIAVIEMPDLQGLTLSGAARGTVNGFSSTTDLAINLSGASKLDGSIESGKAKVDASGSSQVTLKGSATDVSLVASGASRLNLGDWVVTSADMTLSGASTATVYAKDKLDYELSGASRLTISGNPKVGKRSTSGASAVSQVQ